MSDYSVDKPAAGLELNCAERFMLADHRASYPIFFYKVVTIRGEFTRDELLAAIHSVNRSHARLSCTLVAEHGRIWLSPSSSTEQQPSLTWIDHSASREASSTDVISHFWRARSGFPRPPMRFLALRSKHGSETQTSLVLEVFHAVFDGLYAQQYLRDIMQEIVAPASFSRAGSASGDDDGGLLSVTPSSSSTRLAVSGIVDYLRKTLAFIADSPHSLLPHPLWSAKKSSFPASFQDAMWPLPTLQSISLEETEVRMINASAANMGANLNGLLIACILFAIRDFWKQNSVKRHKIRLSIPVSHRNRRGTLKPENCVSFTFLSWDTRDGRSLPDLARWVTDSLAPKTARESSNEFMAVLDMIGRHRWLLPLMTRLPFTFSTATVTNLGNAGHSFLRPIESTDSGRRLEVLSYAAAPYIRPRTQAGFAICGLNEAVTITCIHDSQSMSSKESKAIMHHLQHRLNLVGVSVGSGPRS